MNGCRSGTPAARARTKGELLAVPVANPDFDAGAVQAIREDLQVRAHVVIRIDHFGLERLHALRGLVRRHRVGQVHRHERDVDVLERLHLRDALGVAREVEALAPDRHDVAVATALRVEQLAGRGAALQVARTLDEAARECKVDFVGGFTALVHKGISGGDEVVRFEPTGPEDVQAAEQESDYINHVFMQQNDGFMTLYNFIKDSLISKTGIVKIWWDERELEERETYYGLTDEQFAMLALAVQQSNGAMKVVEHTARDANHEANETPAQEQKEDAY